MTNLVPVDRLTELFRAAEQIEPPWQFPLWCEATGDFHYEFVVPISFVRPELESDEPVYYCVDCMSYLEVSA